MNNFINALQQNILPEYSQPRQLWRDTQKGTTFMEPITGFQTIIYLVLEMMFRNINCFRLRAYLFRMTLSLQIIHLRDYHLRYCE